MNIPNIYIITRKFPESLVIAHPPNETDFVTNKNYKLLKGCLDLKNFHPQTSLLTMHIIISRMCNGQGVDAFTVLVVLWIN